MNDNKCPNPNCRHGADGACANPAHHIGRAVKKPVQIEFIEWTGNNLRDVISFTGRHVSASSWAWEEFETVVATEGLKIFTLEGSHMAAVGDLIIKGVNGEFYPCKPDIFAKTYTVIRPPEIRYER